MKALARREADEGYDVLFSDDLRTPGEILHPDGTRTATGVSAAAILRGYGWEEVPAENPQGLMAALLKLLRKFDPSQPRDPGGEGGGQWVSGLNTKQADTLSRLAANGGWVPAGSLDRRSADALVARRMARRQNTGFGHEPHYSYRITHWGRSALTRAGVTKFDPSQPRDGDGKWSETGAGGGSGLAEVVAAYPPGESDAEYYKVSEAGAIDVTVYRTGGLTHHTKEGAKRGTFFGDSEQSVRMYSPMHGGAPVEVYQVQAKKAIVARNAAVLWRHLYGKPLDVAEIDVRRFGGLSSKGAYQWAEGRIAGTLRAQGYDAIIYTSPPAPAKYELAVIAPKSARVTLRKP